MRSYGYANDVGNQCFALLLFQKLLKSFSSNRMNLRMVLKLLVMRILHTMLRVRDLDKSIDFYTKVLGMQLLRKKDYPSGRFTLAFVGYGLESENAVLELTHNWDTNHYEIGNGYGHIALGVENIFTTCASISQNGGSVIRDPGPMKHGNTVIAFVEDPDGYKIELIEINSRETIK